MRSYACSWVIGNEDCNLVCRKIGENTNWNNAEYHWIGEKTIVICVGVGNLSYIDLGKILYSLYLSYNILDI